MGVKGGNVISEYKLEHDYYCNKIKRCFVAIELLILDILDKFTSFKIFIYCNMESVLKTKRLLACFIPIKYP